MNAAGSNYVFQIGKLIENRWRAFSFSEPAFADIATQTLVEHPPCDSLSFLDAARCSAFHDLPLQSDIEATFGQPPVTVYLGEYFRIELLFWVEGAPGIHQHAFSGAFHVLHGSSVHSLWTFEEKIRIRPALLVGELKLKSAELLSVGDTRRIEAGRGFIHSTFHLERPSVTVVVRTIREEHNLPQYSYWPPCIAYDPQGRSAELIRRLQVLQMLATSGRRQEFRQILYALLDDADAFSAVYYFFDAYALRHDEVERNDLFLATRLRYPEIADSLVAVAVEQERRSRLIAFRRRTENPDLRFFLALLLNVPDRAVVFDLIRKRYLNRDPITAIVAWLIELRRMGLLDIDFGEYQAWLTSCLLRGMEEPEIEQAAAKREHRRPNLKNDPPYDLADFRDYWLLKHLFCTSPSGNRAQEI